MDCVLREGVAYAFPKGDSGGVSYRPLEGTIRLVFNTSNTPEERERTVFGDPLERIWKDCIFAFCGVHVCDEYVPGVADSTPEMGGMAGRGPRACGPFFPGIASEGALVRLRSVSQKSSYGLPAPPPAGKALFPERVHCV
ncbi:MAG: hypothetical protein V8Q84_00790 [Bilophila sp.]